MEAIASQSGSVKMHFGWLAIFISRARCLGRLLSIGQEVGTDQGALHYVVFV